MTDEEIARHEAGHATACLLLGIEILGLERNGHGGVVRLRDRGVPASQLRDHLVMTLCGPIMQPRPLPDWPPCGNAFQKDERDMHQLAVALRLDEPGWFGVTADALNFTTTNEFMAMWTTLTGLHERMPIIGDGGLTEAERIMYRLEGGFE